MTDAPTYPKDYGRSRFTAVVRLALAGWLLWSASQVLLDPSGAAQTRGAPVEPLLWIAAARFAIGLFLVTGFMTRVGGLLLIGAGVWEILVGSGALEPTLVALSGAYLMLRGSGSWAMDVYVQMMQDRVRLREAQERQAAERRLDPGEAAAK